MTAIGFGFIHLADRLEALLVRLSDGWMAPQKSSDSTAVALGKHQRPTQG
jgi:hypothetical protein